MPTLTEPTGAQIAAGNYRKEHVRFQGLDLAIETPKGSERRGTGADGNHWSVTMPADYGYINRTTGADDEQVDCYVGPDRESADVWVIDQLVDGTTAFDEHKVMLGFSSKGEAVATYKAGFSDGKGADRLGKITHNRIDEFVKSVADGYWSSRHDQAAEPERTFQTPPADANDHQVAEGIRDGIYASPQQFGDFWLFDLRITGTGMAYRDSIDEWAFRDTALWLSDEFVQRCNGLAVIFGHPERSGLNHEEFRERAIGSIVLPYIKGDEVWGVAKIFDADSAVLMQTTHTSTSPGVTPPKGSTPLLLEHGTKASDMGTETAAPGSVTKVLDEALPLILDHLAVCEAGVWDKDGPPDGIRLDTSSRKDSTVADEDLQSKLDAMTKERDDMKSRLDAQDAKKDESGDKIVGEVDAKKDAEGEGKSVEKAEKSAGEKIDAKKDAEETEGGSPKNDGAKVENVDAERGIELHDSKALRAELDATRTELSSLRGMIDGLRKQPTIEDRDAIATAFQRADSIYQMLGDVTPQTYPGESPIAYRRRLVNGLRKYSDTYKTYTIQDSVDTHAFDLLEGAIYTDALAAAKNPAASGSEGILREVKTMEMGKQITRFHGDARKAWEPFMPAVRNIVKSINNAPDRR